MKEGRSTMMRKKVQKAVFLAAVYLALLVPAMAFAEQGASLSRDYFRDYNINVHSLTTPDGYNFDFMVVVHKDYSSYTNHSLPVVVSCHGLGNSKEESIHDTIHFATNGYFLLIPDLRGHGSHEGFIRLDKEHEDVSQMVDFVGGSPLYPMANASNVGMWGHSNGAFQSVMTAIHDTRVQACIASSGAYNTSELLRSQDPRLYIVGFPWGLADREEIRKRSPVELANATSPKNLLLYHGTADTNVPFIHSQQFNKTVNPYGNRTDYEFHVIDGAGHGLVSEARMQNDTAWFDKYLKYEVTDPATVPLFHGPFSFEDEVESKVKAAAALLVIGALPLVFLLEEAFCTVRNNLRKKRDAAGDGKVVTCNYFDEIRSAYINPPVLAAREVPVKDRAIALALLASIWFSSCFVSGALMAGSMLSRVLTFFGIPTAITLASAVLIDLYLKKKRGEMPRMLGGLYNATFMPAGDFVKDLVLAIVTIIPAWLIEVLVANALGTGSVAAVKVINLFLRIYPRNPLSPGIFLLLGLFIMAAFTMCSVFRGPFTLLSKDKFDNTAYAFKGDRPTAREMRRFFRWFYMMLLYALFVGGIVAAGCALYLAFMPNAMVPDVDFEMGFNETMALAVGLIAAVTLLAQQVFEKVFRSFNKSVLMTALVLLSFYVSIAPRPM